MHLTYWTRHPLREIDRPAIEQAVAELNKEFPWWGEPVDLFGLTEHEDRLSGSSCLPHLEVAVSPPLELEDGDRLMPTLWTLELPPVDDWVLAGHQVFTVLEVLRLTTERFPIAWAVELPFPTGQGDDTAHVLEGGFDFDPQAAFLAHVPETVREAVAAFDPERIEELIAHHLDRLETAQRSWPDRFQAGLGPCHL